MTVFPGAADPGGQSMDASRTSLIHAVVVVVSQKAPAMPYVYQLAKSEAAINTRYAKIRHADGEHERCAVGKDDQHRPRAPAQARCVRAGGVCGGTGG